MHAGLGRSRDLKGIVYAYIYMGISISKLRYFVPSKNVPHRSDRNQNRTFPLELKQSSRRRSGHQLSWVQVAIVFSSLTLTTKFIDIYYTTSYCFQYFPSKELVPLVIEKKKTRRVREWMGIMRGEPLMDRAHRVK
jgi:hypothetical protein